MRSEIVAWLAKRFPTRAPCAGFDRKVHCLDTVCLAANARLGGSANEPRTAPGDTPSFARRCPNDQGEHAHEATRPAALREPAQPLNDVFWIYEPHCARFAYVSPAYTRDWLRDAEALYAGASQWFAPVQTSDRSLVTASFERLGGGEEYAIEYRTTAPCGSVRWISETAVRSAEVSGQPLRFAGVSHDITARKSTELALLRSDHGKDGFLAVLWHQLCSPLQPIRSAAALLPLRVGLSVVRSLVELHGGHVSARSDGRAKGSEFAVTLPWVDAALDDTRLLMAPLSGNQARTNPMAQSVGFRYVRPRR